MHLDSTMSGEDSPFLVNTTTAGDQENAKVALLKGGGAVFVWQGGTEGYQHIFAKFMSSAGTFLTTTDLLVSRFTNSSSFQVNPSVAVLNNSNVVVTWSSFNQASSGSLLDVYAKILSPTGQTVSNEFLVNTTTAYNQRSAAVAALAGGGFVVTWISEQPPAAPSAINETNGTSTTQVTFSGVDVYARMYNANGTPVTASEFQVDAAANPCANPAVAAGADGGFAISWAALDFSDFANGWDVFERAFSSAGLGTAISRLNTHVGGNQYAPQLAAAGLEYMAVWTSLGQDGSREGVYGQYFHNNGDLVGNEFRVNTTTVAQQMQPAVASDGSSQFLAVWTSFVGLPSSFDLYAQRYVNVASVIQPMSAPFVWAPFVISNGAYQPELTVTWGLVLGVSVADYEVYVDGAGTPAGVVSGTTNAWTMTAANGLAPGTTHSFAVDYVTTGGQRSLLSPVTSGTTWSGGNYQGIPVEWMTEYYGTNAEPANVNTPLAPGGPSVYQVFLSGGNPTNPSTWLNASLARTAQGMFLRWNTQAGATYQVQVSTDFKTWTNVGAPRFAAGTTDSMYVGSATAGMYRLVLMR
jgi:hypothetical protein